MLAGMLRETGCDVVDMGTVRDDEAELEADFVRWGYCLVADAMTPDQVLSAMMTFDELPRLKEDDDD